MATKRQRIRTNNRKLLREWSKAVRERDGNKCCICGKTEFLNAHHLLSKNHYKECRTELMNGITLCPSCHKFGKKSAHLNAFWIVSWVRDNRKDQYDWIMTHL